MESSTKVFLTEQPNRPLDLDTVKAYGDLAFFFDRDDRRAGIFQIDEFCADLSASFSRKGFRPERDYFCLTGGLITVSITLAMLTALYERINVLLYDAREGEYIVRALSTRGPANTEQDNEQEDGDTRADRMLK